MEKPTPDSLEQLVKSFNQALSRYPEKDWNYSRIILQTRDLSNCPDAYVLWYEMVDPATPQGRSDLKALRGDITWGDRHSSELGMLEIVSLRLNKALLAVANEANWGGRQPVLRLSKKELLTQQGYARAIWYEVREVSGEEFESR